MRSLDDLLSHLLSLKRPFVVGHESADPDAVGAAVAVGELVGAPIGFPSLSREGKLLLKHLSVPYELSPNLEGKDAVVVDTNNVEMLGGVSLEGASSVTVIDHHSSPPTIQGALFIFPEFSSTSEIVCKLFRVAGKTPSEKTRFALLSGILFDTKNLLFAGKDTLDCVSWLLPEGKKLVDVTEVFEGSEDVSERIAKLKALRKGRIIRYGDFLVAVVDSGSFEASVATTLVKAGADVGIALTEEKSIDRMSIRVSRRAQRMGISALELVGGESGCGGHPTAVGCKFPPGEGRRVAERVLERLFARLKDVLGDSVIREY